jgi:hypothetical protein
VVKKVAHIVILPRIYQIATQNREMFAMMVGVSTKGGYMNVRPLVWRVHPHEEDCGAISLNGSFDISARWQRYHLKFTPWDGPNDDLGWFDDIDDAKDAANDKHKEHIMGVANKWIKMED